MTVLCSPLFGFNMRVNIEKTYDNNVLFNLWHADTPLGFAEIECIPNRSAYLSAIEIYNKFQNAGNGTHLLKVVENYCKEMRCSCIYGQIVPDGEHNRERLVKWYVNQGYTVGDNAKGCAMFKLL